MQEVVPAGTQVERAQAIAAEICQLAPLAVQEIKRGALMYLERGERAAFDEIPAMRATTAARRTLPKDSHRSAKNARRDSRAAEADFSAPSKPNGATATV